MPSENTPLPLDPYPTFFIAQQLQALVAPAGQGASTATTFTLLGPIAGLPNVLATLTVCLGGSGYDTAGALGALAWTISAATVTDGTAGAYIFVPSFSDPLAGIPALSKEIVGFFEGVATGAEGQQILHAVNTVGTTASYDTAPFKGGNTDRGTIAATPVLAPTFGTFVNKVVNYAIDAARSNAAGVGIITYPNVNRSGLTLAANSSFAFANAKTGSSDAYGQLSGSATDIVWTQGAVNGVATYTAIADESEAVFAQAMTGALTGQSCDFDCATLGSQALVTAGDSSTSYMWVGWD